MLPYRAAPAPCRAVPRSVYERRNDGAMEKILCFANARDPARVAGVLSRRGISSRREGRESGGDAEEILQLERLRQMALRAVARRFLRCGVSCRHIDNR